jgi:predicted methyltransferase
MEKGVEQGIKKVIRQLLATQSAEQVAQLTNLPLEMIMQVKQQNS